MIAHRFIGWSSASAARESWQASDQKKKSNTGAPAGATSGRNWDTQSRDMHQTKKKQFLVHR